MTENNEPIAAGVSRRRILRWSAATGALALGGVGLTGNAFAQPGQGAQQSGKFQLHGSAEITREPGVRPVNHVVVIDTSENDPAFQGSASRSLGVQADDLDGKLSFDYNIESGDCRGGSPRLILSIDNDGDGEHDFHLVTDGPGSPGWASCPDAHDDWESFDSTDDEDAYWRIHPGGGYMTWTAAKVALDPDHTVLSGALVDDSFWQVDARGVAYYDNITLGDRTLSGNNDVVGRR